MKIFRTFVVILGALACARIAAANTATLTTLHHFGVTNSPYGSLDGEYAVQPPTQGNDGNFYGTTFYGGMDGNGTVYMMTPQGTLATLYFFQGYDGIGPRGFLVETNGLFYGTTQEGGINITGANDICCGTIFTITTNGTLTTVHNFDSTDGNTADSGILPGATGIYYGTTYGGGTVTTPYTLTNVFDSFGDAVRKSSGTVYSFSAASNTVTTLHSFAGPDGANPGKEAVVGSDGNIYGTTLFGGSNNAGTVFTVTSNGMFTLLYAFTGGDDGAHPKTRLAQGPDGNFYGTTLDGGGKAGMQACSVDGCGTVFKITPQGTLTTLHDFSGDPEPAHPGSLTLGPDGNFYGTSNAGGTNHNGTIFMITPAGDMTTLYQFNVLDGSEPIAGLTLVSDGSFYGATTVGGAYGQGTIFRVVINTNMTTSSCTYTLSPASITLTSKGGAKSISVKAVGTGCAWSATSTDSFITITAGATGTGSGKVAFSVPGNTNAAPLTGTINIAGQTFTINQAAGGCTYKLSPKLGKLKSTGGTAKITVTPTLTDCAWSAVTTNSFITITSGATGTGKGTVMYTVPANTTTSILTGTITIAGQSFPVIQAGVK